MIDIKKIDLIVFDFDGVLTDNKVLIDQKGNETVFCSRSDGLGFDVLKILRKSVYIISTEKNLVVSARAKKLNIPVLQGVSDKAYVIKNLAEEKNVDENLKLFAKKKHKIEFIFFLTHSTIIKKNIPKRVAENFFK